MWRIYLNFVGAIRGQLWVRFGQRRLFLVFAKAGECFHEIRGNALEHLVVDLCVPGGDPTPCAVPEVVANGVANVHVGATGSFPFQKACETGNTKCYIKKD